MAVQQTGDKEQAASHRARAEELRAVADGMGDRDAAAILRSLADRHDATAQRLEQAAGSSKPDGS